MPPSHPQDEATICKIHVGGYSDLDTVSINELYFDIFAKTVEINLM